MFSRVVAASIIAIWFALFTIEFLEDSGLIKYAEADMDEHMEATLASLGEAIKRSDETQLRVLPSLFVQQEIANTSLDPNLPTESVSFSLRKEAEFLKAHFKIHKLHQVFLI